MGLDYALVHLKYTIPPAIVLSYLYRPLCTKLDIYKLLFLITIAVVSTIPWDSYLIRSRVWTYPQSAIIGPTLLKIPLEELFFFIIQTYNTTLIYLLLSKPTFHPIYLRNEKTSKSSHERLSHIRWCKWLVQVVIVLSITLGWRLTIDGGKGMYMGLIIIWAGPFLLLLWSLAYQFLIGLPRSNTLVPILVPTLYLWTVDTLALQRGTWVIESGTKIGWHVWPALEIEEAVFFLMTNMLIVFGLVAFDNALAILDAFPRLFPSVPAVPSPILLVQALLVGTQKYDADRIQGLQEAVARLRRKSRSFYLASGVFEGRLRVDLTLLYSFCRVADDLIDDSSTLQEMKQWIEKLKHFVSLSYAPSNQRSLIEDFVKSEFPMDTQSALLLLPTNYISAEPLYDLLKGFEMDSAFSLRNTGSVEFPIKDEKSLQLYGARVAGTVAHLCLELVFHHLPKTTLPKRRTYLIDSGARMGVALQYVNISRDILIDASANRVYLPSDWLADVDLSPAAVIKNPTDPMMEAIRSKLLRRAFSIYEEARGAIEELPKEARASMRVAVESYMEIGRVLREEGYVVKAGRATVPKLRRLKVAWKAMNH